MPARPQFDLPKRLVWATNSSRTLDPDDTAGSGAVTKEDGWETGKRPPARVMNWIHNFQNQWIQHIGSAAVGNWFPSSAVGAASLNGAVFVPGGGRYRWVMASGTNTYYSQNGTSWTSTGAALTSAAVTGAATLQGATTAVFGTSNGLEHSSGALFSPWTQVLKATMGITNNIYSMDSKATGSSFVMAVTSSNEVAIAASGVTGAWAAPTTPPTAAINGPKKLIWAGGSTWYLMSGSTTNYASRLFRSTDDGDVWTQQAITPSVPELWESAAYDPGAGRLIIAASEISAGSDRPEFWYTDDGGATQGKGAFDSFDTITNTKVQDIYSCGSGLWVACCIPNNRIIISSDNGETWHPADAHDFYDNTAGQGLHYLAGDGHKLIALGTNGYNGYCLSPGRVSNLDGV